MVCRQARGIRGLRRSRLQPRRDFEPDAARRLPRVVYDREASPPRPLAPTAADRHFAGRSATEQGNQIAVELKRFEAGPEWQKVKGLAAPPDHYRGTLRECVFHVLKAGKAPAARTIRAVLAVRELPAIR